MKCAFVGWEEGGAGQIDSWLEQGSSYKIACFVITFYLTVTMQGFS